MRRYDEVAALLGRHNYLVFGHDHVRWVLPPTAAALVVAEFFS